jgi:phosphatidylserine/phosphatidylglycerophosphate/cardiolipin synthase-like enzyme
MRAKNNVNELELYCVAGTHTVILSLDMKNKPANLLGFAFERKENKTGKRIWLNGQKCFQSVIPDPVAGQQYPTYLHPVQGFLWKDFTVDPASSYTYKVTPVSGSPLKPEYGTSAEVQIKTEPYKKGKHGVYFNRGVSGSQSYAEKFGNQRPDQMVGVQQQLAYEWLSRGLFEGLKEFIQSAEKGQQLRGAFYEFHFDKALQEFKNARDKGVDVKIVYSGKSYKVENEKAIAAVGIQDIANLFRDNQVNEPHNKFMVLCDKKGNALKVWTGSTNISEKGIFGQCNTGHIINDKSIADQYLQYWKALSVNPTKDVLSAATTTIQPDVPPDKVKPGMTVFFSARQSLEMLQNYATLIEGASEMVCCIYPFNIDKRFQTVFQEDKPYIRYILLDQRSKSNTFVTNDKDVEVTAGSYIKSAVDQWASETSAGKIIHSGVDYVHNKIILIDALSASPIVITGSANYSENSTLQNDENTLIIKGDTRVADIYFTEFVRLFDHFSFREWLNSHQTAFKPFLDETGQWVNKYFDNPENLSVKRKNVFKNMAIK